MKRLLFLCTFIILLFAASIDAQSSESDLRLLLAANSGDLPSAEKALAKGARPNFARFEGSTTVLHYASKNGHAEIVKLLIKKGAALETQERAVGTCLLVASENGQLEVVKVLVEAGANLNAERPPFGGRPDGRTALILAAENLHSNVVSFLLARGARVNVANTEGQTPLMLMAASGWTESARLAVEKSAQINAKDNGGGTALMIAAMNGHTNLVKLLLAKGAAYDLRNTNGDSALSLAAGSSHWDAVRILSNQEILAATNGLKGSVPLWLASGSGDLEAVKRQLVNGADVNGKDPFYKVPSLIWAARNGRLEIVQLLIAKGADVNIRLGSGRTALTFAAANGHVDVVKFLMDKGADKSASIERDSSLQYDALSLSVARGNIALTRLLLEKGAKIDRTYYGKEGATLLHQVRGSNGAAIARLLIKNGASVDGRGFYSDGSTPYRDKTPLMQAARNGEVEVAKVLLENGANVEAKDEDGDNPLRLAARNGHVEVVSLLVSWMGKNGGIQEIREQAIWPAIKAGKTGVVSALLKAGVDPNCKDSDGYTLLLHAASNGVEDVCKLLLDSGAKINSKINDDFDDSNSYVRAGDTPLHAAARRAGLETVAILLANGANVNARNKYGTTPLFDAKAESAELLLGSGADPNFQSPDGFCPLIYALWLQYGAGWQGSPDKAIVLVQHGADVNASVGFDLVTSFFPGSERVDFHKGSRPLHLAVSGHECSEELVKLLLEKGASVNAKNDAGRTALSLACFKVRPLLEKAGGRE